MSTRQSHKTAIRQLRPEESAAVGDILGSYADAQVLLWRTAEDIMNHHRNFLAAEVNDRVIGCVAVEDYGQGLIEIRSLAVEARSCGGGVGSQLIRAAVERARGMGAHTVFALTVRDRLFLQNGFEQVSKEEFPEKVWRDCAQCRKRDCCTEIAVRMIL